MSNDDNSIGTKGNPCPTCGWPFVKADNDAKATLAGQSAHVIDLELAVDRLAAEKAWLSGKLKRAEGFEAAYRECAAKLEAVTIERDKAKHGG